MFIFILEKTNVMKKKWFVYLVTLALPLMLAGVTGNEYIVISWNDLGMHCSNKDFSNFAVLPPYNNLKAQVIRRGTATSNPEVVTSGYTVNYSIPGNTYSVGKTNFWSYAQQLFGVNLQPNIGLTGVGLTGNMVSTLNYFHVEGIPITPYTDNNLVTESPYQLAMVNLRDAGNILLHSTQPVIPVSNELSCVSSGCHSSETDILNQHEEEGGFDPNNTPILCADCHADNALGMPGTPGVESFSYVIHSKHQRYTNDCYKCHPGPNTQCFRDVMHTSGMVCQDCHGSVAQVAQSIADGREPWLEEPSCGASACHGNNYAEEPGKLFKESQGHGGLFCSACHGSPHAIQPTEQPNDNIQNIALQGFSGTLRKCEVCHTIIPNGAGPHGYIPTAIHEIDGMVPTKIMLLPNYPNPFSESTTIPFAVAKTGKVRLEILTISGKQLYTIVSENFIPGNYSVSVNRKNFTAGIYLCRISQGAEISYSKIAVIN
jgi:hypothetical protein